MDYKFDAVRWCKSRARTARAQRNFADENSFVQVAREIEELMARLAEAEAKIGRWQGDMNAVLDQRNDYHANVVALRDALDIIQSGFEYRNGDPKMDGTFDRFPHVLNRSRMMDIAREALAKLEAHDGK